MGEAKRQEEVRDRGVRSNRERKGGRKGREGMHGEGGQEGEEKGTGRGWSFRPHGHF